jgi:hypothetical protein
MSTGWRLARDAYIAAVYPAGPEPIIRQFIICKVYDFEILGKGSKNILFVQIIEKK